MDPRLKHAGMTSAKYQEIYVRLLRSLEVEVDRSPSAPFFEKPIDEEKSTYNQEEHCQHNERDF